MEQLPSEVVSSTFSHLSTIELGLTMSVCKGWKEVLLGTSPLWRHIDLPTPKHTVKIIEVFASRSRNTLVSIKGTADFNAQEAKKVFCLLELSKRTVRAIDLRLDDFANDYLPLIKLGGCLDDDCYAEDCADYEFFHRVLLFFQSFPKLERLNLTGSQLPEVEVDVLGDLVVFGTETTEERGWSEEKIRWLSKLKVASVYIDTAQGFAALSRVISACTSTLSHLQIQGFIEKILSAMTLNHLEHLEVDNNFFDEIFEKVELPNLKHINLYQGSSILENKHKYLKSLLIETWEDETGESQKMIVSPNLRT